MPMASAPTALLVFKVLSVGPYGEGFAVGAVAAMIRDDGLRNDAEFFGACLPERARGTDADHLAVQQNLPLMEYRYTDSAALRAAFWPFYTKYHQRHYTLAAQSPFPVEHSFFTTCIAEHSVNHDDDTPTPFLDLGSVQWSQGKEPGENAALSNQGSWLHPLHDARRTAGAFYEVFGKNALLKMMERDELLVTSILLQGYNRKAPSPDPLVAQSRELIQLAMFQRRKNERK